MRITNKFLFGLGYLLSLSGIVGVYHSIHIGLPYLSIFMNIFTAVMGTIIFLWNIEND